LPSEGKGHTFESCRVRQIDTDLNKAANSGCDRGSKFAPHRLC
jgi:hypothetical protein